MGPIKECEEKEENVKPVMIVEKNQEQTSGSEGEVYFSNEGEAAIIEEKHKTPPAKEKLVCLVM